MRSTKYLVILILSLMIVGFASVTTILIIQGNTTISSNTGDFDVRFIYADTEDGGSATISPDGKTVTYVTSQLKTVGDYVYVYGTIKNFSTIYDADVNVHLDINPMYNGVDYSDYIQIGTDSSSHDSLSIPANSSVTNAIYVQLIKPVVEDVQLSFSFSFTATAVSREELAEPGYSLPSDSLGEPIEFDELSIGDEVTIGTESFYVIGYEYDNPNYLKLLAKYNLNVGNNTIDGETLGKQDSRVNGDPSDPDYPKAGTTYFCKYPQYYMNGSSLRTQYGTSHPAYVYNNQSNIYQFIKDYQDYLNTFNVHVSGRLISYEDLLASGCVKSNYNCSAAPDFLFTSYYWTGSTRNNTLLHTVVKGSKSLGYTSYLQSESGVRPVIILER